MENRIRSVVCQQAVDWFFANREGLDARQREAFAAWLTSSPLHVREYLGVARTARDLPAASADPGMAVDTLLESAQAAERSTRVAAAPARTRIRGYALAAAAVVAACGVGLLWWSSPHSLLSWLPARSPIAEMRLTTRHGELLTRRLADGSLLHLNTDTVATVRYAADIRVVDIERGQAMFEVAHDPQRKFVVRTPGADVSDVGTQFDVYVQQRAVIVTVVEGRVAVLPSGSAEQRVQAQSTPVVLDAGQQIRVVDGEWPSAVRMADLRRATAWLRRQIVFAHEPLDSVAAEFNRYSATPIIIETPALRTLPVSGTFAADDTDSFIAFLRSLEGVHVEVTATRTRVWRP